MAKKSIIASLLSLALLVAGVGCTPPVTKAEVERIKLHQTTTAEMTKWFGKPKQTQSYADDHGNSTLNVWFGGGGGNAGMVWIVFSHLVVETKDDTAAGFLYVSNDGKHATRFDPARWGEAARDKWTKAQAIAAFGPPHGVAGPGTGIEEFKKAQRDGVAEVLAWADAQPIQGWFKPDEAKVQIYMLQFDADGQLVGKASQMFTRRL